MKDMGAMQGFGSSLDPCYESEFSLSLSSLFLSFQPFAVILHHYVTNTVATRKNLSAKRDNKIL